MKNVPERFKRTVVAVLLLVIAAVHASTPAGPHPWHWLHVAAERAYYVPLLLAATWWGLHGAVAVAVLVTALVGFHVAVDWRGLPMVQLEQLAEIGTYWLVGVLFAVLMSRERRALDEVRDAHEETLGALARSLELREKATAGHSARVRDYALLLADRLGYVDEGFRRDLALGAFLHDVGKIGIPDRVLLKEGPLTDEERKSIERHPTLGADLIGDIPFLQDARELVLTHHERYDGKGYPGARSGEAIPLGARIFAVADVFDALTTDRPYHTALSWAETTQRIAGGRGTQFDPLAVDAFLQVPYEEWARIAIRTGTFVRPKPVAPSASAGGETNPQVPAAKEG